jgi:hypothetical protein
MKINAELKETKQSKKGLDNIYRLVFETDNPLIMDLGKLPSDSLFTVDIDIVTS